MTAGFIHDHMFNITAVVNCATEKRFRKFEDVLNSRSISDERLLKAHIRQEQILYGDTFPPLKFEKLRFFENQPSRK